MFTHILTSTDGSDWARKGVLVAIEMAKKFEARLSLLTVSEYYPDYYAADAMVSISDTERSRELQQARADDILREMRALTDEHGIAAALHYISDAHPATAIYEKAEEYGCDLIVIGSRGRRGLTKLFLGSQAAEVLAGTHLPVLIVK